MSVGASASTNSSLVRRVQSHEPESWRQFVELYGPLMFAWVRRFGLSAADAADVTQEAFIAIARGIADFRHDAHNSSLRGWLWTITRNKARDWARKERTADQGVGGTDMHQQLLALADDNYDDSSPTESRAIIRLLHRGLQQVQAEFEPRTWQAFWLVVVEGRGTADVAEQLGMSANLVRQCRSRVLRRLREQMGEVTNL